MAEESFLYRKRKGNTDDPFVEYSQTDKVRNNKILLKELPSKFQGATITSELGITLNYKETGFPDSNTVVVDWKNGELLFDDTNNGKLFTIDFFGEGNVYVNASKVFMQVDEDGNITETVKDIIDDTYAARDSANNAATNANTKATYATEQGDYAKLTGDNLTHKGAYSSIVAYKRGNVVQYGGSHYMCMADTTAGTDPLNGTYWSLVSPQSTLNDQTWTATEGQTVYTLTNGTYAVGQGYLEVYVGGVPQITGDGFTETNDTSFTLSAGVSAGTKVYAKWFEGAISITKGHKATHELGGADELDITKLKNFQEQVVSPLAERTIEINELKGIIINAEEFGAKGDGTNQQTAIQDAINFVNTQAVGSKKGGIIYFEEGDFVFNTLTLYSHIHFVGKGKNVTKFKKLETSAGGTDADLIRGDDKEYISFKGISFVHQTEATNNNSHLIRIVSTSNYTVRHITIEDCMFIDTANGRQNLFALQGLLSDIYIRNNKFTGYSGSSSTYEASLLLIDNLGFTNPANNPIFITNNYFVNGKRGVVVEGSGTAPDIYYNGNKMTGQTKRGLSIYHGNKWKVDNNEFTNITAVSASNNDGGAVWLDVFAPDVTHKGCAFSNNVVTDITGNAVLLEEFKGVISGNEITNVSKRTGDTFSTDYTYESVTTTITSDGGHGIHVTGGCIDFLIEGNKIRNVAKSGINLDRAIGIQKTYEIKGTIRGNKIQSSDNGIEIMEKVQEVDIIGNEVVATNDTIKIDRKHATTNNVLGKAFISGNVLKGKNGINKTYGYGYGYIVGNTIERDGTGVALTWANNQGSTSGNMNINKTDKTVAIF